MLRQFFSFLARYFTLAFKINLVAHEYLAHIVVCESFDLMHPLGHILKGFAISNVIHDYYAVSASVVAGGQRSESLLTCCIPDLKFDVLAFHLDGLNFEIDTDCVKEVFVE